MASRGQPGLEPVQWIQAVRRAPGANKPVNTPRPSTSKVATARSTPLDLSKARPAYVTPKTGSSSKPKQQQAHLRSYFSTDSATPIQAPKKASVSSAPPRKRSETPQLGKPVTDPRAGPSRLREGTRVAWNSDDEVTDEEADKRPVKRMRHSPPLLKKSPHQSLSKHEAAFQAGIRRSVSPVPPVRKFVNAEPEGVLPNPFEGEVFSQLPFEEQTVDLAMWARLADMDEPPPRSPPRPKPRVPAVLEPPMQPVFDGKPTRMPSPPIVLSDSPVKDLTSVDSPEKERIPGSSQTLSDCEIPPRRERSPSQTQHDEQWELLLPDDSHMAHERATELERAVLSPSTARDEPVVKVEARTEEGEELLATQQEGSYRFAILPNTPDRQTPQLEAREGLSWQLEAEEGEPTPFKGRVLVEETQYDDDAPRSLRRESSHWERAHGAFVGAQPTAPAAPAEMMQSSLSAYFKPDSFTKEQQAAMAAVNAARRINKEKTPPPGLKRSESVPSSVSPTKSELSEQLERASPVQKEEELTPRAKRERTANSVTSSQHVDDFDGDVLFEDSSQSLGGTSVETEALYAGGANPINEDAPALSDSLVRFFDRV